MAHVTRPLLQYHGAKFRIAPWIISYFPPHRVYCEPYGGGGGVLLRKEPAEVEIWNDLNDDVVNLFCVLRDKSKAVELLKNLALTPYSREEFKLSYLPCNEDVERARRIIVRSFFSVGTDAATTWRKSGFRTYTNLEKIGKAPVQVWKNYPDALAAIIERIQGRVIIENRDALKIIRQHDSADTLFYCDPPYPFSTRADKGADYSHEMTDEQHREMATVLHSCVGNIVLSGYPCDLYDRELFPDWHRVERETIVGSTKSNKEGKKRVSIEVLWMNFIPSQVAPEDESCACKWQQAEMDIDV